MLYGPDYQAPASSPEFDHRIEDLERVKQLNAEERQRHVRWVASIIAEENEEVEWISRG